MKVLYYDCWLVGNKYIFEIDKYFRVNQHERILLHTASWYNDVTSGSLLVNNNIDVIDICDFNDSFIDALTIIKPDIIIGFNIESISDRSIILLSKKLSIPFIYVAHGNIAGDSRVINKLNSIFQKKIVSRLIRNFRYVLPNYIKVKVFIGFPILNTIVSIFPFFLNPAKNIFYGQYKSEEIKPNLSLVYSKRDKSFLINVKGLNSNEVSVIGDPQLQPIKSFKNDFEKYVLFIDDGYTENGIWTENEFHNHLILLQKIIFKLGFNLKIRLHPRNKRSVHHDFLKTNNIEICDLDLVDAIFYSQFCINYSSSCINIALIFEKTIIAPLIGIAIKKSIKFYDERLVFYARSEYDILNYNFQKKDLEYIQNYIKEDLGYSINSNSFKSVYLESVKMYSH